MPLRFTIRDLLWLTLVAAMAVGWWVDHRNWAAVRDENESRLQQSIYDGPHY
jgi:hypothetical protein